MFGKINQGHNLENKKEGIIILVHDTSSLLNTHSYKVA